MTRRLLVVLALFGIVVSGCSLGPRETYAEAMRNAFEKAARIGGADVHVTVNLKVIQTSIRVVPDALFKTLDGRVDFKHRTNRLVAKGLADPRGSTVFFDDLLSYFPRSSAARADHNPDKRWARFDFKRKPKPDIDANDRLISLGYAMAPTLADEMLQGVLAGSIKQVGTTTMDGVNVTEYSARMAPDAATRDLRDERRRNGILRMFQTIGVKQDIFPFHVWMGDDGLARRIRFILKQEEDVVDTFRTTVDYTFTKYGTPPKIEVPPLSDTLTPRRFVDFIAEYIRSATG